MGLLARILTLPIAPLTGTAWVLDQVVVAAERGYYDPEPVRARLAALERDLLEGRIDEEEFDRREDELLDLLQWLEEFQRRLSAGS